MQIDELARGVIAAGFHGETFDPALPEFGAYVLFARNVASLQQVRTLTDALRARPFDGIPPLIAVDQEGGRVARLLDDVEPMPSMMALGAVADLELAGRAGEQTAFDLRRAGFTLNFAPVLDLACTAENTAIGTRSIGADPQGGGHAWRELCRPAWSAAEFFRVTSTFRATGRRPRTPT